MKAGVYVRISRDREGLEAGVDRQEADCRALCEQRGWEVVEVYRDNDVSASDYRKNRPAYRRLVADVSEGRIEAVVAYSSSRLYRRVRDLLELVELVKERAIEIATVVSGRIDLTTADGRMMASILASVDQGEAERIGERSRRARAEMKRNGKWTGGGARAYGYERVMDDAGKVDRHRIARREAAILREAARRALSGDSLGRIVRDFNDRGLTTRQGRRWNPSILRNVLTAPFVAGMFPDGAKGDWPAILSEDEHMLLRARFPKRTGVGRGKGGRLDRRYRLSGIAFCSECGKKLLGSGGAYRCQARNGGCGKVRISAGLLDPYVEDQTFAREEVQATDPGRNWKNIEELAPPAADPSSLFIDELHAIEARRLAIAEDYAAGAVAREDFTRATEALARRASEVETRIREQAPTPSISFTALLEDPSTLDWNEFYEQFVERIVVSPAPRVGRGAEKYLPERVTIRWR